MESDDYYFERSFSGCDDGTMVDQTLTDSTLINLIDWPNIPRPFELTPRPESLMNQPGYDSARECYDRLLGGRFKVKCQADRGETTFEGLVNTDSVFRLHIFDIGPPIEDTKQQQEQQEVLVIYVGRRQSYDTPAFTEGHAKGVLGGGVLPAGTMVEQFLTYRILHIFLRCTSSRISSVIPVADACAYLQNATKVLARYPNVWCRDLYDVQAFKARLIMIDINNDDARGDAHKECGLAAEALEACGDFEVAAHLYLQNAANIATRVGQKQVSTLNAALAFKRARLFEQAERSYVSSMHYAFRMAGDSLDVNREFTLLKNMLFNYHTWKCIIAMEDGTFDNTKLAVGRSDPESSLLPLLALLVVLRFGQGRERDMGLVSVLIDEIGQQVVDQILKSEFRRPGRAKRALSRAFSSDSVDQFHARLQTVLIPNSTVEFEHSHPCPVHALEMESWQNNVLNEAQDHVRKWPERTISVSIDIGFQ